MSPNQDVEGRPSLDTAAHPTILGFTPVNRSKVDLSADVSDRVGKGNVIPPLVSKSSLSTLRKKRKRSQVVGSTVDEEKRDELSMTRPVPECSKTRTFTDQSISQGLKATKPILHRTAKSFRSAPDYPLTENILKAVIPNSEIVTAFVQDDAVNLQQSEPRAVLSGLGDKYHAACLERKTGNMAVNEAELLSHAIVPGSACPNTLSKTCTETSGGNDAYYSASVQSLQSPATRLEDLDSLQMNWNDDEFPMDDDGIQEMMTLTEIKRSTSSLAFRGHPDRPCLDHEEHHGDLGWLEDSFCLDKHTTYEDGVDLDKVTMNRSNEVSPSSSISNYIQSPSLSSTNHTAQGGMNDVAALDYADKSFDDDDLDFELLEMTEPLHEMGLALSPLTKPATPDPGKLRSAADPTIERVESAPEPPKLPTEVPWMISFDAEGSPIPFIRPPFPKAILDRSPILGLTPRMVLRTCFRIGEALNAASAASRSKNDAIIELYARVGSSNRELGSFKQFFQFSDLFTPEKPPFLAGSYGLWRGVELWDLDTKSFLGEKGRGKMARAIGRIRREERSQNWGMTILSVWPVDWDDVGITKGIVLS